METDRVALRSGKSLAIRAATILPLCTTIGIPGPG
jgi:hypothetical protein